MAKFWLKIMMMCLLVGTLSGCFLAPGMNMNTRQYDIEDVDKDDFREGAVIQLINGELVMKQLQAYQTTIPSGLPKVLQKNIADFQYRVSAQDVLQITVWDHPELTTPSGTFRTSADTGNLVRKDGTIFYPYVGVFPVAGKTVEEIRAQLVDRLSSVIEKPQVDVRVAAFRSQLTYVTGQVNKPGSVTVTDKPLTVMDAIAQSGGLIADADFQHATLTREGKTYELDLFSLYERGSSALNVLLKSGDVLNIPDNQLNKVFVLGEVMKPSTLFVRNGKLSLAEAISDSQGFGSAANPSQVYVIRGSRDSSQSSSEGKPETLALVDRFDRPAKLEIYHLDAGSPGALLLADQFRLHARDVVYVSPTELSRFSRVFADVGRIINTTAQTMILQRTLTR